MDSSKPFHFLLCYGPGGKACLCDCRGFAEVLYPIFDICESSINISLPDKQNSSSNQEISHEKEDLTKISSSIKVYNRHRSLSRYRGYAQSRAKHPGLLADEFPVPGSAFAAAAFILLIGFLGVLLWFYKKPSRGTV
jgi:hypothetical protein